MLPLNPLLVGGAAAGAAVTAAVYANFSARVMPRLASLPPAEGIAAMQQFNRTALQPPFMACFFGTAAASAWLLVRAARAGERPAYAWLAAGGAALYLAGFALTIAYNVPRNERLAAVDARDPGAWGLWEAYVREWTAANTVRAVASGAATACLVAALVGRR